MFAFEYEPMSEQDALKARFKLMDDGSYKGVIEHVESKMSAKGNSMLVVTMRVWDSNGMPCEITDYIVSTHSMIWKLRHLCESVGLLKEFETKIFRPNMLLNKDVMVLVKTQNGKEIPHEKLNGKEPGSLYPAKNFIEDYIKVIKHSENANKAGLEVKDQFNDEIPF